MDLMTKTHLLAALSPEAQESHHPFARPTSVHSSNQPSFPIIAIAIIGILATAFLLVSYYVFVIKCCLNWHRIDILRRFSLSHNANAASAADHLAATAANHSPSRARGLDAAAIRSIPVLRYTKESAVVAAAECAVCLGEYRDGDKLRLIPDCLHVFHIDCIDVWLQTAANCPLCRAAVSASPHPPPMIKIPSPSPSPPSPHGGYVVIEVTAGAADTASTSAGGGRGRKAVRKLSMGDELIGLRRDKDERFSVEPIRRSFSMDSSADRKMFLAIQDAVRQHSVAGVSPTAAAGGSRSVRRSFFSFGSNGSRASSRSCSAVLPVYLDP